MKLRRSYERACRGTGLRFLGPSLVELAMEMEVGVGQEKLSLQMDS